jgi:hypothetical protein
MPSLRVTVPAVALVYDKKILRQTLRVAGNEVASATRRLIRSSVGGGKVYYGSGGSSAKYRGGYKPGRYAASAAGQAPVSVTGTLMKSIKVRPSKSGESVSVREGAFYALFLEAGARGGVGSGKVSVKGLRNKRGGVSGSRVLKPRPSLTTALATRQTALASRIEAAAAAGVRMQRAKP